MLKPFLHPHSGIPSTAHYKQEKTSTPERRDIRTQLPKNQKLSPTFNRYLLIPLNSTNTSEKYINLCRSLHHNTPLSPPLKRRIIHDTNHSLPRRKQHPKSPLLRGAGVCDVCAQLPEIKNIHLKLRNTTPPNSSQIISTPTALLTVTHPSIPSQEGKYTTQTSHYQTKSSTSNLPS